MTAISDANSCQTIIFSSSEDGHRGSYINFVSRLLPCRRGSLKEAIVSRVPAFFLMVEDSFGLYVAVAVLRACFGRRTVGILMRPKPALEGTSARLRLKRTVLKVLRRIPLIQTITIVPFPLCPDFAKIADDWIYDFQLWDLSEREREIVSGAGSRSGSLSASIREAANGKKVVTALGVQNRRKGFDTFARASDRQAIQSHYYFVSGGSIGGDLQSSATRLVNAGGLVIDRHITNDELIELYAASDLIWALYARDYDQASGILGRAVQLGIPAIVRTGSLSHRLCTLENLPHVDASEDTLDRLAEASLQRDEAAGRTAARRFREVSLVHLKRALGIQDQDRQAQQESA